MNPAQVDVHIEELVLHGFAPADRHRIAEGLQRELAGLLAERAGLPSWPERSEFPHVDGGAIEVAPGSRPETISAQIARTIYGRLTHVPPQAFGGARKISGAGGQESGG